MSFLVLYNWTPSTAYIELNSLANIPVGNPEGALQPSIKRNNYYPWSVKLPRDLSLDHGKPNVWGRTNALTVKFPDFATEMEFRDIADPAGALLSSDMLLWIFPDRVVLSQNDNQMGEVYPKE